MPAKTAARILAETGMRPKTILNLKNRNLNYKTCNLEFRECKTHNLRVVKISRDLSIELTRFFKTFKRFHYCFHNTDQLRKALLKYIPRVNIPKPHLNKLYTFRYLYIYNALKKGRSPEDIRLDLGHSDVYYTNNYISVATKAIENT